MNPSADKLPRSEMSTGASDISLNRLRTLLLGATEEQLETIYTRLGNSDLRVKELSHDLPAALIQRAKQDNQLSQALLATVEDIVQTSVERNPQPMVNAIYPAIAPALRRAVGQALRQMVSSMNQTLDHSFSLKGLKWRIEAWRTGRSFAEIAMRNSLLFRVEQLFLIDRETGLLLRHVAVDGVKGEDPDMVSGMLMAIGDFAQDSFQLDKDDRLASVEIGDREIFVAHAPKAALAALVWGRPPDTFRETLNEALEEIHLTCADEFKAKSTDPLLFEKVEPVLERAFLVEERPEIRQVSLITWLFLLGLVALIGYGGYAWWARGRLWNDLQFHLDQEPGIVVTSAERNWGGYTIRGLLDPLAKDPNQVAKDIGIDSELIKSQWEPYQALTPSIITIRARKVSEAPDTVLFSYDSGVLTLSGEALKGWGEKAPLLLKGLPGVDQYNDAQLTLYTPLELLLRKAKSLTSLPDGVSLGIKGDKIAIQGEALLAWFKQFNQLFRSHFETETLDTSQLIFFEQKELQKGMSALAGEELFFVDDSAELLPGDGLESIPILARYIGQLSDLATLLEQPLKIEIKGKTDIRGSVEYNHALSLRRAETIRNLLIENGVPADVLVANGQSVEELLQLKRLGFIDENDRRVEFNIIRK